MEYLGAEVGKAGFRSCGAYALFTVTEYDGSNDVSLPRRF